MDKKNYIIKPSKIIRKFLDSQNYDSLSYLDKSSQENEMIFLDKNESPFVPPLGDLVNLKSLNILKNYPDLNANTFLDKLSKDLKIPISYFLAGTGSNEIIGLIIKIYATPKTKILSINPTFSMYQFFANINGAKYESFPLRLLINKATGIAEYDLDQSGFMKRAKSSNIIILARPNNPDGIIISLDFIKQLLKLKKLVIIDEAYIDFSDGPSLIDFIKSYDNLIISRSFSKSYSLAGLRLGYTISDPSINEILIRIKSPFNVNNLALQYGLLLLDKKDEISANINKIKSIRQEFFKDLLSLREKNKTFYIHPSQTNFILLRFESSKISDSVYQYLLKNKIKVRNYGEELSNCLRFSIGTRLQMKKVIEILKSYFEEN
ncbi:MAG: pyridoxal phosphate-dependent aminotransferase [Promethearchaeota archaeon]